MLNIKTIQCNMLGENCYIVSDETKECVIIDCGAHGPMEHTAIASYITEQQLIPKLHLLTHAHFDHVMGAPFLYREYGLQPVICERDAEPYKNAADMAPAFGIEYHEQMPPLGRCLNDGDTINFGNHQFKAIHTPGHSKGGMVYYCEAEQVAFTGDTLFAGSIGRTDLPGGSMFQIIQSLRQITQLPDTTRVLPGHGGETSIGRELSSNPYLDR